MKLYQPKCCAECVYIRPYGGYKVCSYPFFPAEMSILDISSFKVNPGAIPDWCPLIKINDEIVSMPEEERERKREIVIFQIKDMLFRSNRERIEKYGVVIENGHDFLELMDNILELLES